MKRTKKIYVSKGTVILFVLLLPLAMIGLAVLYINNSQPSFYRTFNTWMIIGSLVLFKCIILFLSYRELIYVKANDDNFVSYFFSKALCVIDKHLPIYYSILTVPKGKYGNILYDYIVLSNEPFEYIGRYKKHNALREVNLFYNTYDVNKFVVMPYNKNTEILCDVSKWRFVPQKTESVNL